MNKQIPLYLLGIGILFLFSGILCLICGVEQSNIFVIEIMYLGLGLAVVAFFLEFIIGLIKFKGMEKNPAYFCMGCGKYLGFRGFCSKECHDKHYDEMYGDREYSQKI